MTEQQKTNMLSMIKVDLGITTMAYNGRLGDYLQSAESQIRREGITLDLESLDDCQLVVMYAAWMWRKRDFTARYVGETSTGMPRMLRYALNNRLFSEKVKTDG